MKYHNVHIIHCCILGIFSILCLPNSQCYVMGNRLVLHICRHDLRICNYSDCCDLVANTIGNKYLLKYLRIHKLFVNLTTSNNICKYPHI